MVIKCIKFIFGNGRILSGFGYIAVGWIVAKKKILSGRISIILGLILLGALYLAGDTWGFLLKFLIAEILLSASCKVTLPQHPIWEHMRYVSEIIYFTHMWVAFSYTLIFREFRATPHNTTPTKENILGAEQGQGCALKVFARTN